MELTVTSILLLLAYAHRRGTRAGWARFGVETDVVTPWDASISTELDMFNGSARVLVFVSHMHFIVQTALAASAAWHLSICFVVALYSVFGFAVSLASFSHVSPASSHGSSSGICGIDVIVLMSAVSSSMLNLLGSCLRLSSAMAVLFRGARTLSQFPLICGMQMIALAGSVVGSSTIFHACMCTTYPLVALSAMLYLLGTQCTLVVILRLAQASLIS